MAEIQRKRFDLRNITTEDLERADRIIREKNYNYQLSMSEMGTLHQLRSLINDDVRNAEDKKNAFYEAMKRHDDRVFKRPGDRYPIHVGGCPMYRYVDVLRKVKSLGGTEFDEYWSED
jgi:hypothetical protein